jgi:hypothetical protein
MSHPDPQEFSTEDRAYRGSRFAEVVAALNANPYQPVWGGAGQPPLPVYEVTLANVAGGVVPEQFRKASERGG